MTATNEALCWLHREVAALVVKNLCPICATAPLVAISKRIVDGMAATIEQLKNDLTEALEANIRLSGEVAELSRTVADLHGQLAMLTQVDGATAVQ